MTYQVRTTRRVDRELSRIVSWYYEQSGSQQLADRWISRLRAAMETLSRNPERCSAAHETTTFDFAVYELLYGSGRKKTHRILFRILDDEGVVEVIGVLHHAQRDLTPDDL